jgi:uncharacterized protein
MNKFLIIFLTILFLAAGFILFANFFGKQIVVKNPTVLINGQKLNLIIAKTDKEKQIGLSNHNNLPENEGMLFPFKQPGLYPFWMKNMQFPIDIIYIKDNKITTIYRNVPVPTNKQSPPVYMPKTVSDTVLEINANLSKKYNFKMGDKVTYENFSS